MLRGYGDKNPVCRTTPGSFEDATDPETAVGEHPEIRGGASGFLDALLFRHTGQAPGEN